MYSNKYKGKREGNKLKEKEIYSSIYEDKFEQDLKFIPSLGIEKDIKKRNFKPNLTIDNTSTHRDFIPSLGIKKEDKKKNFIPHVTFENIKTHNGFIPSLEIQKVNKKVFEPSKSFHDKILDARIKKKEGKNIVDIKIEKGHGKNKIKLISPGPTDRVPLKYQTLDLLNDLKNEMKIIDPKLIWNGDVSLSKLSKLFGKYKTWLYDNIKRNPYFKIPHNLMASFENEILKRYREKTENVVKFIKKYRDKNILPKSDLKIFYYHPEIRIDYFNKTDNKEKAYWLGFIYADGSVNQVRSGENYDRFSIDLARKDKILIENFTKAIKFNPKFFNEYHVERLRNGKLKVSKMIRLEFRSQEFTDDLKQLGVVPNKTSSIELPDLGNRKFNLAFLLGFFDGDGRGGTTNIRSGNFKLLSQIKKVYNLPFKITKDKKRLNAFNLSLGAELFNEMMENFNHSLIRKRRKFTLNKYKTHKLSEDFLRELVCEMPLHVIARGYHLSQTTISRLIRKYRIDLPPKNYWINKKYPGKDKEVNFDKFLDYFKDKPYEDLSSYYNHFPYNPQSVIRKWVYKARKNLK